MGVESSTPIHFDLKKDEATTPFNNVTTNVSTLNSQSPVNPGPSKTNSMVSSPQGAKSPPGGKKDAFAGLNDLF